MRNDVRDVLEVLTKEDGQFNETVGAYVTAYVYDESKVQFELEYVDPDTEDFEIVRTARFTIAVEAEEEQ